MIITQTREQRSFVGSMNPGEELLATLVQICIDNRIFCAHFSGTGYLKNARLRNYNHGKRGFDPTRELTGTFHVVSLHGNVSLRDRSTVLKLHVIGTLHADDGQPARADSGELASGELVGGEVLSFEFSLSTIDDLRLYRGDDARTGLDPWRHMDLGGGPLPPAEESDELPLLPTAPGHKGQASSSEDSYIEIGDWIDHPTLGACKVMTTDDDERAKIQLASGRRVELHLGLLELLPSGKHDDGGRLFKASIRRRR